MREVIIVLGQAYLGATCLLPAPLLKPKERQGQGKKRSAGTRFKGQKWWQMILFSRGSPPLLCSQLVALPVLS